MAAGFSAFEMQQDLPLRSPSRLPKTRPQKSYNQTTSESITKYDPWANWTSLIHPSNQESACNLSLDPVPTYTYQPYRRGLSTSFASSQKNSKFSTASSRCHNKSNKHISSHSHVSGSSCTSFRSQDSKISLKQAKTAVQNSKVGQYLGDLALRHDLTNIPDINSRCVIGLSEDEQHSRQSYLHVHNMSQDSARTHLAKGAEVVGVQFIVKRNDVDTGAVSYCVTGPDVPVETKEWSIVPDCDESAFGTSIPQASPEIVSSNRVAAGSARSSEASRECSDRTPQETAAQTLHRRAGEIRRDAEMKRESVASVSTAETLENWLPTPSTRKDKALNATCSPSLAKSRVVSTATTERSNGSKPAISRQSQRSRLGREPVSLIPTSSVCGMTAIDKQRALALEELQAPEKSVKVDDIRISQPESITLSTTVHQRLAGEPSWKYDEAVQRERRRRTTIMSSGSSSTSEVRLNSNSAVLNETKEKVVGIRLVKSENPPTGRHLQTIAGSQRARSEDGFLSVSSQIKSQDAMETLRHRQLARRAAQHKTQNMAEGEVNGNSQT